MIGDDPNPGTLLVESAYPDPPFDLLENGNATGFDIELMRAVCAELGLALRPLAYSGDDVGLSTEPAIMAVVASA
jgi:ABC-type amino acid transport substrate-binding protein